MRSYAAMTVGLILLSAAAARGQQSPIELGRLPDGGTISFSQSAGEWGIEIKGGTAPALTQPKTASLEIFHADYSTTQHAAAYKTVARQREGPAPGTIIATTEIAADGVTFRIEDRWSLAGQVLGLKRTITLAGSAPGAGFFSAFSLNSARDAGAVNYFIPAGTYRGKTGSTTPAPATFIFREENPAAPMIGMFFKNGSSITMLNPAPRGDTTFDDINPHRTSAVLIDDRLRFGMMATGATEGGGFNLGYWYPGSLPGPVTGELAALDPAVNTGRNGGGGPGGPAILRRYTPMKNGATHEYSLAFRFGAGETFVAYEKNAWRWAFEMLKPRAERVDLEAARKALVDQLAGCVTTIDGRTGIPWIFQATSGRVWSRPDDMRVTMGFVGKNIEAADQLLREAERDKTARGTRCRELGLAIIDSFIRLVPMSPHPAGEGFDLISGKPWLAFPKTPWRTAAKDELFVRAISEDMVQLMHAYRREKKLGRDHPAWLAWMQQYADWLIPQQHADGSFPRSWKPGTNTVIDDSGGASYAPVPLLVMLSQENLPNSKKYLESAIRAAQYIWDNYGDKGYFLGGILDQPSMIDKEAGMLALEAFLILHESTKDPVWLQRAQTAADYAETYIKIWNVPMPVDAIDGEIDWKKGVPTIGIQGVAAGDGAGGGGDQYMAWSTASYVKLYKLTGDRHYLDVARILLHGTKSMLALPGRTFDLAGPGWQQEHWSNRGFSDHRGWLPWVTTNHLVSITALEELDPALFQELAK